MQANQSADAEGYGDPEDEDEAVAAGDDDDDSWDVVDAPRAGSKPDAPP